MTPAEAIWRAYAHDEPAPWRELDAEQIQAHIATWPRSSGSSGRNTMPLTDAELTAFAEAMGWYWNGDDFVYDKDGTTYEITLPDDDLPAQYAFVATVAQAKGCMADIRVGNSGSNEWEGSQVVLWHRPGVWFGARYAPTPSEAVIRAVLGGAS